MLTACSGHGRAPSLATLLHALRVARPRCASRVQPCMHAPLGAYGKHTMGKVGGEGGTVIESGDAHRQAAAAAAVASDALGPLVTHDGGDRRALGPVVTLSGKTLCLWDLSDSRWPMLTEALSAALRMGLHLGHRTRTPCAWGLHPPCHHCTHAMLHPKSDRLHPAVPNVASLTLLIRSGRSCRQRT